MRGSVLARYVVPPALFVVLLAATFAGAIAALGLEDPFALQFERPWALILLVAAPFALFVSVALEWRRTPRLRFSRTLDLATIPPGPRALLRSVPPVLRAVALALLAVALAQPQTIEGRDEAELEGIDIMIVMDLSNSMRATDLRPNRMIAAKQVIDDFILRRHADRIGAVVFGREAYTLCPLTLDYGALRGLVASLDLGVLDGRGTAIGNGVGTAINRLRRSDARSKVIILLTDGDSNSGNMSPDQAAEFAKTFRIKVHSVLMGIAPDQDAQGRRGRVSPGEERYPVRPDILRAVSEKTGGEFFHVGDTRALQLSFHKILDQLDRSKLAEAGVLYHEAFSTFAAFALLALLVELGMRLTFWRKFP
jgi:Ca-activated chloride channel family protein